MDLSIIMPAYNEQATILEAVQSALDAELPVDSRETIAVEKGSADRTRELLRSREWPAGSTQFGIPGRLPRLPDRAADSL